MKILDAEQTKQALPFDRLIKAIDDGFCTEHEAPLRHHHNLSSEHEEDQTLLLMPAWLKDRWGGVKLVNVVPGNTDRGLPGVMSSYILFDRQTGQHVMLLDGAELTARRTAAVSALAAKRLARKNSSRLLVVGSGNVGKNIPFAYRTILPIQQVDVFSRSINKSLVLVAELKAQGFDARVVTDIENAVRSADIISCATFAKEPIIKGEWLQKGQHLDLIGSFTPTMREADDSAIKRANVFIDTAHAMVESGDICLPLENGTLKKSDIKNTLKELCKGDLIGRKSPEEITLFKGVGCAIEDLAAAICAYNYQQGH